MANSIVLTLEEFEILGSDISNDETLKFISDNIRFFNELSIRVDMEDEGRAVIKFYHTSNCIIQKIPQINREFYWNVDSTYKCFDTTTMQEIIERDEETKLALECLKMYVSLSNQVKNENRPRVDKCVEPCDTNKGDGNKELLRKIKLLTVSVTNYNNEHGKGTPHSHEYDVRGFIRHLKDGRKIWIEPYTRCKGRGLKLDHQYAI